MMGKIIGFIIVASVLGIAVAAYQVYRETDRTLTGLLTPTQTPAAEVQGDSAKEKTVEHTGRSYRYGIIRANTGRVRLLSNLQDSSDSATVKNTNRCGSIVNAGFYTKEFTHLGYFHTEGRTVSRAIQNATLDGYLYSMDGQTSVISYDRPSEDPNFGLQTGPVLRSDNSARRLSIVNDEYARRVTAGTGTDGSLYFIAVTDPDNAFTGPLLADLPNIIDTILTTESLTIPNAINLDGGSASVFITDSISFSELQPAGGFFCIRDE